MKQSQKSKPKTVYQVVKEYAKDCKKFETVISELTHLKKMREDGEIDERELKRQQRIVLDRYFELPPLKEEEKKEKEIYKWRYYSILDTTSDELMETGRNSSSLEEAITAGIAFIGEQVENDEWERIEKLSIEEKVKLLKEDDYAIIGHTLRAKSALGINYEHINF